MEEEDAARVVSLEEASALLPELRKGLPAAIQVFSAVQMELLEGFGARHEYRVLRTAKSGVYCVIMKREEGKEATVYGFYSPEEANAEVQKKESGQLSCVSVMQTASH